MTPQEEATEMLKKIKTVIERVPANVDISRAKQLYQRADKACSNEDFEKALSYLREADSEIDKKRDEYGKISSILGEAKEKIGYVKDRDGKFKRALRTFEKAKDSLESNDIRRCIFFGKRSVDQINNEYERLRKEEEPEKVPDEIIEEEPEKVPDEFTEEEPEEEGDNNREMAMAWDEEDSEDETPVEEWNADEDDNGELPPPPPDMISEDPGNIREEPGSVGPEDPVRMEETPDEVGKVDKEVFEYDESNENGSEEPSEVHDFIGPEEIEEAFESTEYDEAEELFDFVETEQEDAGEAAREEPVTDDGSGDDLDAEELFDFESADEEESHEERETGEDPVGDMPSLTDDDDLDDIQIVGEDAGEVEAEVFIAPPEDPEPGTEVQDIEFDEDVPSPPDIEGEEEGEEEEEEEEGGFGPSGFDIGWDEEEEEEEEVVAEGVVKDAAVDEETVLEITRRIENIRESVGSAPSFLDVSTVKSLVGEAEEKLSENDLGAAQELVERSGSELEALKKEYREASERFEEAKEMLKKANETGIDIAGENELLKQAKKRLDAGELGQMKELSEKCIEELEGKMLEPVTREKMLSLKSKILKYKEKGVDIKSAAEVFNTAGILMKERNFKQVLNLAEKSQAMAEKSKDQFVFENMLAAIENGIERMKDTNPEIEEIGKDVENVKSLQKQGEFAKAQDLMSDIERRFRDILEPMVSAQLKELDEQIEESENAIYVDEEKEERLLATDAMDNGNFVDAFNHITTALKSIDETKKNSYPLVTLRFVDGELKKDVWNRAKVILKNTGKAHAKGIKVDLVGPVVVRRLRPITRLNAKEEQEIEIAVKFDGGGSVPVDVEMTYKSAVDGNEHETRDGLWIDVGNIPKKKQETHTGGGREPPVISPGGSKRCKICLGVIKDNSKLYECGCGRTYHNSCIQRTLECPSCGLQYQD